MTQYGLSGVFISLLIMTIITKYVSFIWKYFIGIGIFVICGGLCSIIYSWKIRIISKPIINQS